MIKEVAEKTKKVALLYFPVVLMGIMGVGMSFQTLSYAIEVAWLKIAFAILSLPFFGVALYICIKLLIAIGKSIEEDEKNNSSKTK